MVDLSTNATFLESLSGFDYRIPGDWNFFDSNDPSHTLRARGSSEILDIPYFSQSRDYRGREAYTMVLHGLKDGDPAINVKILNHSEIIRQSN